MKIVVDNKTSKNESSPLSSNLKTLLQDNKLSENDIAQALDVPVMTVRRIVSGETTDPRISTLKMFADYFDVSIDALVGQSQKNQRINKDSPQFIPLLDWQTLSELKSLQDLDLNAWKEWQPIVMGGNQSVSAETFALESKPSMQPRFPRGTLFIIDPQATPIDCDVVLIRMKDKNDVSLRELIIDPPTWQLQSLAKGSENLIFDSNKHEVVGSTVMTMLHTRKQ